VKLKIGIDGSDWVVDVEVLEDDEIAPSYLPPHGEPTTVRPVSLPVPGAQAPPVEEGVDEAKVCRSPVSGVVVKINVRPGQQLQANDLIMVLEAMKMETHITAPIAGQIKRIAVGEGDGVKMHQILVEFE